MTVDSGYFSRRLSSPVLLFGSMVERCQMFEVLSQAEAVRLDAMLQEAFSVCRHIGQRATIMARESKTQQGWAIHNDRANDMARLRSEQTQLRVALLREHSPEPCPVSLNCSQKWPHTGTHNS